MGALAAPETISLAVMVAIGPNEVPVKVSVFPALAPVKPPIKVPLNVPRLESTSLPLAIRLAKIVASSAAVRFVLAVSVRPPIVALLPASKSLKFTVCCAYTLGVPTLVVIGDRF